MITIIIFTFLLIILAYSKKLNTQRFSIYYGFVVIVYTVVYFKYDVLTLEQGNSLYENIFYKYFPFLCTLFMTIYIRYDVQENVKSIENLEEKIIGVEQAVEEVVIINENIEEEKKNIEKRLISQDKEAIKIRAIISEIADFKFEKIEDKILNYFNQVLPSAEMDYFKYLDEHFVHMHSNYQECDVKNKLDINILNFITKSEDSVFTQLSYKRVFKEKIIIKIVADNSVIGVILVTDIDFKMMNKVTMQSLKYFVNLFSLQVQTAVIHQRQKELSFSYNSKNIYNVKLLTKLVEIRVALAKREKLNTCAISLSSDAFKNILNENSSKVFDDFEELYTKYFRLQDAIIYNHINNKFIIVMFLDKNNLHFIVEKIKAQMNHYEYELDHVWMDEKSNMDDVLDKLGVEI